MHVAVIKRDAESLSDVKTKVFFRKFQQEEFMTVATKVEDLPPDQCVNGK